VSNQPITILNVDDNEASRYIMSHNLKQAGFQVIEASSGDEALQKVTLKPDVIILDVRLPDMSGFEVCRRIRQSLDATLLPVILISAVHVEDKDKIEGLEGGADVYLTNPVELNVLIATIKALLRARSAETDLLNAAHRWQTTFDTMNDAICVVNWQGIITQCNKAMASLVEKPLAELTDISFLNLIGINSTEDNPLTQVQKSHQRAEIVLRFNNRWLNFAADPIFDITGNINEVICILTDVTEVREYMLRLQMSNSELENFASIASHDLREPLRKIQMFSSRLHKKYNEVLGDEGGEYFDRMQSAIERGMSLIEDLLEYSKITTQARSIGEVNLNQVLQEVINDLEHEIKRGHATLQIAELPIIEANQTQMYRLFQNLITNALKYHHSGRLPLVKVFAVQNEPLYCEIHVSDNGIGIKSEHYERIFGLFERLHGHNQYTGTGIGLAICRKIVHQHHGTIDVMSIPDEGSVFIVRLPLRQKT
jgi:PAS domain S-box-containing protein